MKVTTRFSFLNLCFNYVKQKLKQTCEGKKTAPYFSHVLEVTTDYTSRLSNSWIYAFDWKEKSSSHNLLGVIIT